MCILYQSNMSIQMVDIKKTNAKNSSVKKLSLHNIWKKKKQPIRGLCYEFAEGK